MKEHRLTRLISIHQMSLDCFRFAAVQKIDEQPASLPGRIEIEVLQPHSNCQKICGVSDSLTPRLLRWRLENRVCTLCLNLHRSVLCLSNSFSHHCCVATPSYGWRRPTLSAKSTKRRSTLSQTPMSCPPYGTAASSNARS